MKNYLCKFTVVVTADDDSDHDEIWDEAISLLEQNIGNFEYEEA